jgi:HlyD family secretion protein
MKNYKQSIAIALLMTGLVLLAGCAKKTGTTGKTEYVYQTVSRGAIEKTVSSSGTIEPVSEVSVLAQMSGIAEKVYANYNDKVTKGQTLVELNTDMLKLQQEEQKAAVSKARANYELQLVNYQNQLKLAEKGLVSDYDVKSSKTTLDVDAAELASAESALKVIETEISQYAFIKSPITGIVLERDVEVGQSVVEGTSSNSSSIFTLAEDLTHMQIEATVAEIDISSIHVGQKVRFTVEAQSGRTYTGKVQMIRLVPETSDSVVYYYVIIAVDNADGTLLPGMTAEVEFIVSSDTDALLVVNSALRYEPTTLTTEQIAAKKKAAVEATLTDEQKAELAKNAPPEGTPPEGAPTDEASATKQTGLSSLVMGGGGGMPGGGPGGPGGPGQKKTTASSDTKTAATTTATTTTKYVWYMDDNGELSAIAVTAGVTDGSNTEVTSAQELEGVKIITKEKVS